MAIKDFILIVQIIVSILLIALILIQPKGAGLGKTFSKSQFYSSKKGIEKIIFIATIISAALFLLLAIAQIIISVK